jgi:hypothetical protein
MSGVAGADRIERQFVEPTIRDFTNRVLNKFPGYESAQPSGSYNTSAKQDFGDIDLIVHIEGTDKKTIKKDLQNYLESLPTSLVIPFDGKHQGKRTYNAGELVSIRYPQFNNPGKSVQIDCIVALDANESNFKKTFLDYPAEVQGLILGLVKTSYQEAQVTGTEQQLLQRFNIDITSLPNEPNTKYEFNLSGQKLEFRSYEQDEQGREIKGTRNIHWSTTVWGDVTRLLPNFDFNKGFESILAQIEKTVKAPSSKVRIKGIFNSMISVKSGEVGTPKAKAKEDAIKKVNLTLEASETGFIRSLTESKLYRFTSTQKYDWEFLKNLTFANILALHILRQVDVTENYIKGYIQKTYKAHNFNYPNHMYTDLYMNMHGLIGSNKKTRDFSTDIINKKVNLNHVMFLRYLKILEKGIDVSESRRELYRLQKEIAPKETVLHSLRRMIQEWPTLDFNQKRLIFTRLYFWLKNNARLLDIMEPFLIAMQANNMLIPDAKDK